MAANAPLIPPKGRPPTAIEASNLAAVFLNLKNFLVTAPESEHPNCVAFTVGWPQAVWPPYWPQYGRHPLERIDNFYRHHGFTREATPATDGTVVALYCKGSDPKHVALRIDSTWWESKLGEGPQIVHLLDEIECPLYGAVFGYYNKR